MGFTNEIWLALRTDVADGGGTGTPADPYCVNTPDSFADVFSSFVPGSIPPARKTPANSTIRFGPGVFRTRGGGGSGVVLEPEDIWNPRSGQKIIGSGIFATTIRMTWDLPPTGLPGQSQAVVLGRDFFESFELSDLTLDLALQDAPYDDDLGVFDSGTVTVVVSGTTITATTAVFTAEMASKRKIVLVKDPAADFYAVITTVNIVPPATASTTATIDRSPPVTRTGAFLVYGVRFAVTGVAIAGSNVRFKRVRIINFGTRTPLEQQGSLQSSLEPARTWEGFPARIEGLVGNDAAFNCVLEDCIFEQPYPSPAREVTCAVLTGGIQGDPSFRMHRQPFGGTARNNYFNFDYVNPRAGNPVQVVLPVSYTGTSPNVDATVTTRFPVDVAVGDFVEIYGSDVAALNGRFQVAAIGNPDPSHKLVLSFTFRIGTQPGSSPTTQLFAFKSPAPTLPVTLAGLTSSTTVTVTTSRKHHRKVGDWICISAAGVDDYNGTFKVSSYVSDFSFRYQLITAPSASISGGSAWLDRRPSGYIRIKRVEVTDSTNKIAKVTAWGPPGSTYGPHYRKPGDWIAIGGLNTSSLSRVNAYNSYVKVLDVDPSVVSYDPRTSFFIQLYSLLNTSSVPDPVVSDAAFAGGFQAISVNGGIGGGMFGNRVANGIRGGTYHDFWWEDQYIARNNYYYNMYQGPRMHFFDGSFYNLNSAFTDCTLTVNATVNVVRVQLQNGSVDPGYRLGMAIRIIQGAVELDGEIIDFISPADFTVSLLTVSGLLNGSAQAKLWFGQQLFFFEDNIIDLALAPHGDLTQPPSGVYFAGPYWPVPGGWGGFNSGANFPWALQLGIVRDNYIRKVNGATDPALHLTPAIGFWACRSLIVEGNVFPVMNFSYSQIEYTAYYADVANVKAFNNQNPNGHLWQLMNWRGLVNNNEYLLEEVGSDTEDVMLEL